MANATISQEKKCQDCGCTIDDAEHLPRLCNHCESVRVNTQPELLEACEETLSVLRFKVEKQGCNADRLIDLLEQAISKAKAE